MKHLFDVEIAQKYGIPAAILLENLGYWIKRNEANGENFFDGTYWTYNSRRAYRELFPYLSERQVETAFRKLIDDGLVITGNYNAVAYDRTLWYALTQKGKCILHFDGMDSDVLQNGSPQNVKPIPDINTDINTDIKTTTKTSIPSYTSAKRAYGTHENVMLTEKEYNSLVEEGIHALACLDYLSDYMAEHPNRIYFNHYQLIRNLIDEDLKNGSREKAQ